MNDPVTDAFKIRIETLRSLRTLLRDAHGQINQLQYKEGLGMAILITNQVLDLEREALKLLTKQMCPQNQKQNQT